MASDADDKKLKKLLGKGNVVRQAAEKMDSRQDYRREAAQRAARGESMPPYEEWKRNRNNGGSN